MPGDAVAMSKKPDKDDDEVPERVRKAQKKYLDEVNSGKRDLSKQRTPYGIDWETGEPLDGPKSGS